MIHRSQATKVWAIIHELYSTKAEANYGLSCLSQREHALQTAYLAKQSGCSTALIVAELVHDIGHMIHMLREYPAALGVDDRHEVRGADFLAQYFDAAVVEPVRLHVLAKRYLCAVDNNYLNKLSLDSRESLLLQGGVMSTDEIKQFLALPYATDALFLRRLDEEAKRPEWTVPGLEHYMGLVQSQVLLKAY